MAAADRDEQAKKRGLEEKYAAQAKAKANVEIYKAMLQNVSNASNLSTLNTARQASVAGATERSPRDATERSPREAGAAVMSALPGKPLLRPRETDPAAATAKAKAEDRNDAGHAQAAAAKAIAEQEFSDKPAAAAAAAGKKRQGRETWVAKGAAAPLLPEEVNAKGEALLRAAGWGGGDAYRRISPEYYLEGRLQNSAHDRFV